MLLVYEIWEKNPLNYLKFIGEISHDAEKKSHQILLGWAVTNFLFHALDQGSKLYKSLANYAWRLNFFYDIWGYIQYLNIILLLKWFGIMLDISFYSVSLLPDTYQLLDLVFPFHILRYLRLLLKRLIIFGTLKLILTFQLFLILFDISYFFLHVPILSDSIPLMLLNVYRVICYYSML